MALAISDDHKELAAVAAAHLMRQNARTVARDTLDAAANTSALWASTAELGWLGLHVPEEFGGSGFGLPELTVVLEALGHELAPVPFLPTVTAAAVLAHAAPDELRSAFLPGLTDGSLIGAVGIAPGLRLDSSGVLTGESRAVLGAPDARVLVLVAGDDVVVLDSDLAGVTVTAHRGLDTTRSIGTVAASDAAVPANRVLRGAADVAVALYRILTAAEAAGSASACLETALEYVKTREQFGRPVGTFQAVKHHLANMLIGIELAVAATWDAARSADLDRVGFAAAVAAANATRAQVETARLNIQLHGGIGFTWEHDAHLYLRRADTVAALLSDGRQPLVDVVAAHRAGQAHGASLQLPPEAAEFREQARAAVQHLATLPESERRDYLVDSGYLVPHWRKPWGREAGAIEQLVIEEEFQGVEVPELGIAGWVTLTLSQVGSEEQKMRWIDPVLRGKNSWCQLFSEPGAGSDAAAVRTSATRVDGGWRVNGQKVWTSAALGCQWGLATVRTDPGAPKHAGVTMMAIDLTSPNVEIRPLREITGDELFNEVFFDDVFVPDSDVVGAVGEGWKVARATLGNERISIGGGSGSIPFTGTGLVKLLDSAVDGHPGAEREVGEILAEEHTIRLLNMRQAVRAIIGAGPGPEANVTKLVKAEHSQRITNLGMTLAGTAAVTGLEPDVTYPYLFSRCLTIAGGTSEIMRNTISERILGLPRDPLVR
ncbi:acyl-CoA dehydrogenase [Rhodococcus oxybenzonivorans]|uniref:acyl-CoA dehydrogenase n=1 Tax=Rhodococcus oxybenzonivorans TaxID=1990687 RepID=UPI002955462B|nr:acyl-CoA dehydrogenase [Rhodococcus oxybenzonivorans]MDV7352784.1 acyl-CoA dehydrogenase [Rhodococcus oxybenzonivorans]